MYRTWGKIFIPLIAIAILAEVLLFRAPLPTAARGQLPMKINKVNSMTAASSFTAGKAKRALFAASGVLTLQATEIDGTNAHLSIFPDPIHPTLQFTSNTIYGMRLSQSLSNLTLTISATGVAVGNGVTIKTSVFSDLMTALGSFTNKADLLILIGGGTVKNLIMKNVTLKIDRYLTLNSLDAQGLQLSLS
ncbi:MAG: hypothetical protein JO215_16190 [Ktedonobacteraceae bacterium]|nr:hypothetical protein [Ktedonobacteraceae bacterium]